jgi:hypothetical protein
MNGSSAYLLAALALSSAVALVGCGAPSAPSAPQPTALVVCPAGSAFDAQKGFCVAGAEPPPPIPDADRMQGTGVARVPPPPPPPPPDPAKPIDPWAAGVAAAPGSPVTVTVGAGGAGGVDVKCTFASGWVSLLPVSAYPRDDSFLMQGLIGLTQDPRFWGKEPEFAKLRAYAARKCTTAGVQFSAPPGDYWVLAGQEGTFAARQAYKNNGVRRKITVAPGAARAAVTLGTADLTHTWLCISCPWLVFGEGEGSMALVVLRGRAGRGRRGTERVVVTGVPVVRGRLRLRVAEREHEVTHLGGLRLEVEGRELMPLEGGAASALVRGANVELARGTEIAAEYAVPGHADGVVDVVVTVTGHYDPIDP